MIENSHTVQDSLQTAAPKRKRRRRFWKTGLLGLAVLVSVFAAANTFALLNVRTESEQNELNFGKTEITITEEFDGWEVKEVTLTAVSGSDYVPGVARAMLVPYILDSDGNYISCDLGAMSAPVGNKMVLGDITLEFASNWSTYWFYQDGYFYYKEVLNPGDSTTMLLSKVSLTNDTAAMREKYADTEIKIEVMAAILQAEGGAPASEWGITVTGTTVSP